MKQTLLNQTKRFARMLVVTGLSLCALTASAQMSGTVTIDATAGASSTNFKDWYSFWRSLQGLSRTDGGTTLTAGVSGPVVVNVNSDLTETSQVQFPQITGMSSTNTITINGGGKILALSITSEVISFQGGDYFKIKNLTIRNTSTSTTGQIVRFSGASDYNTIEGCNLEFSTLTSGSTGAGAYVVFCYTSGSATAATSTSTGSYDTIRNCNMRTLATNSAGPSYAIAVNGNTSTYSSTPMNNTFEGNKISNFYYTAIRNYYTNGNQFLNNDISRTDAGSAGMPTNVYLMYSYMSYAANRSTKFDGNVVHDLPQAGASASSSSMYYWQNYMYYNYGASGRPFIFNNNVMKNLAAYYYCYAVYGYYNYNAEFTNNVMDNVSTYASGYSSYGYMLYYGNDLTVSRNTIKNCSFGYYAYNIYIYNTSTSLNPYILIEDNVITNNYAGYYFYGIQCQYYFHAKINRNLITKNSTASNQGYFYGIYCIYLYNWQVNSNIIADNFGYYGNNPMYSYSYNSGYAFEARQNTIRARGSNYTYCYIYGLLCQEYYHSSYSVAGNIIDIANGYYCYPIYAYNQSQNNIKELDNNTYWIKNMSGGQNWYNPAGSASDFNGWMSTGLPGKGEKFLDPDFFDVANGDYRPKAFECHNNTNTTTTNPKDVFSADRNKVKSDRGGVEIFTDIQAISTNFSVCLQL